MRIPFDFDISELVLVMRLVVDRMEVLSEQGTLNEERSQELYGLGNFIMKLGPVILASKQQEISGLN